MPQFIIALAIFLLFILVTNLVRARYSSLKNLPLLPDEKILFEEEKITVRLTSSPVKPWRTGGYYFKTYTVRVTNQRIILAQGQAASAWCFLQAIIDYTGTTTCAPEPGPMNLYTNYWIAKEHISVVHEGEKQYLKIHIPFERAIGLNQKTYPEFQIFGRDMEKYRTTLDIV